MQHDAMPNLSTPKAQLVDVKVDGGLEAFVRTRLDQGLSWRRISLAIRDETGLDVTHESLRAWCGDMVKATA